MEFFKLMRRVKRPALHHLVLILVLQSVVRTNTNTLSKLSTEVNSWAGKLSVKLVGLAENITGYKQILSAYTSSSDFEVKNLNGTEISADFGKSLEKLLQSKTKALLKIKNAIESADKTQVYDSNLKEYKYRNVHYISTDNTTLVVYPQFSTTVAINVSHSFVQIPTNIYEKDVTVLNSVKTSEVLNNVFVSNRADDPTLLWQYYGDATNGAFRSYPGKKWTLDAQKRDLYDCRRRGWFITASSSPKDLVIIIDRSGTMIGNNFGIAKVAALFLIDTLQENDFFNVLYFNTVVLYALNNCKKELLQATKENKEKVKAAITKLKQPEKTGNVEQVMKVALMLLRKVRGKPKMSAGCNQAIAFFSDGVEGDYAGKNAFDRYNQDKHVRVFSFLVGRKKVAPKEAMIKMSCENRGHFYKIETVGNIWDNALKYITVLSRPLSLAPSSDTPIYTPLYLDASGLGMMMTVAIPAFKQTKTPENADLLGVAGTDITVSSLEDRIPYYTLGSNGYGFVINNNGFLLLHPLLRGQEGYLLTPPNVYLEDVVRSLHNESVALKLDMINGTSGHKKFILNAISKDGKRFTKILMNYFYNPMHLTPFSACVAIPEYDMKKLKAKSVSTQPSASDVELLKSEGDVKVFIAKWPYCNITAAAQATQELSKKAYPTAEEIRVHLQKKDATSTCNMDLIADLLMSAHLVKNATENTWNLNEMAKAGVQSVFVGTSAGYSRAFYTGTVPITRDLFNNEYYDHAINYASTHNDTVVFSVPMKSPNYSPFTPVTQTGNVTETYVTVSMPVKDQNDLFVSVVGMKMRHQMLKEILKNETVNLNNGAESCAKNDSIDCYLVDENGYVVTTNGVDEDVGQFLGNIQGKLVEHLSHNHTHVFMQYKFRDTQAECKKQATKSSGAMKLLTPFFALSAHMIWLAQTFLSLMAQFTMYSSMAPDTQVYADTNVSCVKNMIFYVIQDSKLPNTGMVKCSKTCENEYAISKVANTNLALVAIKHVCTKSCREPKVSVAAVKIPDASQCPVEARDRKLLNDCYAINKTETTKKCGSAVAFKASFLLMLLSLFITANCI